MPKEFYRMNHRKQSDINKNNTIFECSSHYCNNNNIHRLREAGDTIHQQWILCLIREIRESEVSFITKTINQNGELFEGKEDHAK